MKKTLLFYRKALFMKIALFAALIVGGGDSAWAQKSLPYSYGFETSLATEGWTLQGHASSNNQSSTKYSESQSFRFYNNPNYATYYQHLYSPELLSSPTGVDVSFYYTCNSTSYIEIFEVGYSTTTNDSTAFVWGDEIVTNDKTWHLYEASFPTGTKYVSIHCKQTSKSYNLFIDDFRVTETEQYKSPKDFSVKSFTGTSTTFKWTGNTESAWQLSYSTDKDFTLGSLGTTIDISTNPYTLSGLTEGTTYYAAIRANYGDENYSEWTDKVEFTPIDILEIYISEDASTTGSYNLPISSANVNNSTKLTETQFIIPASELTEINNRQITKLIFYASKANVTWGAATFEVYLKETNNTTYSTSLKEFEKWGTNVYNDAGLSTDANGYMIIELNTPFNYKDKNLMVGFKQKTKGTTANLSWYSVSATNNGIYSYANTTIVTGYLPKTLFSTVSISSAYVKIGSTGYTTFSSAWPLDLSNLPSGLTAYYATASGVKTDYVSLTPATTAVSAGTGLILKGTAGQTYAIPVADSGSDLDGNLMTGVPTLEETVATSDSKYVLVNNNGTPEFQNLSENAATVPGGKAYLDATGIAGARSLRIVFEDEMTGIRSMNSEPCTTNSAVFDLQGRRVANGQLMKGLYIQNGKKMILK